MPMSLVEAARIIINISSDEDRAGEREKRSHEMNNVPDRMRSGSFILGSFVVARRGKIFSRSSQRKNEE